MIIGIEFIMVDGRKDWYDSIDLEEFNNNQTDDMYNFEGGGYQRQIPKSAVKSYAFYCPNCNNKLEDPT